MAIGKAIDAGADPNLANCHDPLGLPPLHFVCQASLIEAIEPLVSMGASLQQTSASGLTPAAHAVKENEVEVLLELQRLGVALKLESGFFPKVVIHPTLLHLAMAEASLDCVPVLLDAGVDPMATTSTGDTAVHFSHRFPTVLSMLADRGFSLNAVNARNGDTVSHRAVRFSGVESWLVLLDRGAIVDTQNHQGVRPIEAALEEGSSLRDVTLSWLSAQAARRTLRDMDLSTRAVAP